MEKVAAELIKIAKSLHRARAISRFAKIDQFGNVKIVWIYLLQHQDAASWVCSDLQKLGSIIANEKNSVKKKVEDAVGRGRIGSSSGSLQLLLGKNAPRFEAWMDFDLQDVAEDKDDLKFIAAEAMDAVGEMKFKKVSKFL